MSISLPTYDQIPNVGLYLEQVTKYVNEALEPMGCAPLTGSMISNYVKKGLLRNPVKKQYDREHIARLMVIAVSKTVLPLEDIARLPADCPAGQEGYAAFCAMLERAMEEAFSAPRRSLLEDTVDAVAHRLCLEARLRGEGSC